jgi:hypothetical protein
MSWRIYSRNGGLAAGELRHTVKSGDKHVAIWESLTKRVATICRSLRKASRRDLSIVARTVGRNFPACERSAAQSLVSRAAENTTAASSIRGFG